MAKTVRIANGESNVVLPNGHSYDAGDVVVLTDAQYDEIADTALGDEVLTVGGGVVIGDSDNDLHYIHLPVTLSAITGSGDLVNTTFTPGFAGTIKAVRFITDTPATTAAKAATLAVEINDTAVTGGAVALTTAGVATKAAVVSGSAVTAANVFDADDTIKLTASAVTAFAEGSGFVEVLVTES